jgi:hypothetical protein
MATSTIANDGAARCGAVRCGAKANSHYRIVSEKKVDMLTEGSVARRGFRGNDLATLSTQEFALREAKGGNHEQAT